MGRGAIHHSGVANAFNKSCFDNFLTSYSNYESQPEKFRSNIIRSMRSDGAHHLWSVLDKRKFLKGLGYSVHKFLQKQKVNIMPAIPLITTNLCWLGTKEKKKWTQNTGFKNEKRAALHKKLAVVQYHTTCFGHISWDFTFC